MRRYGLCTLLPRAIWDGHKHAPTHAYSYPYPSARLLEPGSSAYSRACLVKCGSYACTYARAGHVDYSAYPYPCAGVAGAYAYARACVVECSTRTYPCAYFARAYAHARSCLAGTYAYSCAGLVRQRGSTSECGFRCRFQCRDGRCRGSKRRVFSRREGGAIGNR